VLFAGGAKKKREEEEKKLRFIVLFLGGGRKPEGSCQSGKAEARRAASAQAAFPTRRARERKGRQKRRVTGGRLRQNPRQKRTPVTAKNGLVTFCRVTCSLG
jgi:hypothetical protein